MAGRFAATAGAAPPQESQWTKIVNNPIFTVASNVALFAAGVAFIQSPLMDMLVPQLATDAVHRVAVLSIVGFCVVGLGSCAFNIWANSDYAPWNKDKLKFDKVQYEEARKDEN